jgi:hypothetical protein
MKIIDLASEIWQTGGALQGGIITLLAQPPRRYQTTDGTRLWLFHVGDNDDAENGDTYFTALGLIPLGQRQDRMREVTENGGFMSIQVHHITPGLSQCMDEENGRIRLVRGHVKVVPEELRRKWDHAQGGFGYHEKTQALITCSFDASHNPVHAHHLCLDDDGKPVSRDEKLRRIAAMEAAGPARDPYTTDGHRRMISLARLHREVW